MQWKNLNIRVADCRDKNLTRWVEEIPLQTTLGTQLLQPHTLLKPDQAKKISLWHI
jgi:hypothetical protein